MRKGGKEGGGEGANKQESERDRVREGATYTYIVCIFSLHTLEVCLLMLTCSSRSCFPGHIGSTSSATR